MEMKMADQRQELNQIIRGKRTKRQRLMSPFAALAITSSSSSGNGDQIEGEISDNNTEEEEDIANCLILLAQGSHHHKRKSSPETVRVGFDSDAYRCKTCDRCFSSFQALGGHRASHKKPKAVDVEDKRVCAEDSFNEMSTSLSFRTAKSNCKVHECSVCGADFSSGQALGGHMRRHRTNVSGGGSGLSITLSLDSRSHEESHDESKKPRRTGSANLQLDLNLPAAAEDVDRGGKEINFQFGSKEQVTVFSAASPLVDCHY